MVDKHCGCRAVILSRLARDDKIDVKGRCYCLYTYYVLAHTDLRVTERNKTLVVKGGNPRQDNAASISREYIYCSLADFPE